MPRYAANKMPATVKRRYFELIRQGLSGAQAARRVGVSMSCGSLWFIDIGQPALPLPDDHRLERPVAVAGHVDLHVARGVGQQRLGPLAVPGVAPVATSRLVLWQPRC
jgi:hypothetical protein